MSANLKSQESKDKQDLLYNDAVRLVLSTKRASISSVQRRFRIGYNRAATLIEAMETAGIVGPMESNGQREILVAAGSNIEES